MMKQTILGVLLVAVCCTWAAGVAADDTLSIPVPADNTQTYRFEILTESGYTDERGRQVIDVLEGYHVNLAISVDTPEGRPVIGLQPNFELGGSSILIPPGESTPLTSTDESGILEFGIVAGQKGMDELVVSFGDNEASVYFNIISLSINDFPTVPTLEFGLNWSELMQAELEFVDGELKAVFPRLIEEQDGDIVKVSGFMMPMDPDLTQRHFLLTSSPPHCFFHIPGGPAGVIEVFSEEGIDASWDPVLIEGRLELVSSSATGVIYQLQDAVTVDE